MDEFIVSERDWLRIGYFISYVDSPYTPTQIPDLASLAPLVGLRQLVLSTNRLKALGVPADGPNAFLCLQSLDLSYNMLSPTEVFSPETPLAALPM